MSFGRPFFSILNLDRLKNAKLDFLCVKSIAEIIEELDKSFWSDRYARKILGWDAGSITTPIKEYVDQLSSKDIAILIPGCGTGHEAVYLHDQGFSNVTVIDLVEEPINNLKSRCKRWSDDAFIISDFFNHTGNYDLIIEQTFFCALNPGLRQAYAEKMHDLLKPNGKLVGVLFGIPLPGELPPYGGDKDEYRGYFEKHFRVKFLEPCYNSIEPRKGSELFINLIKEA